MCGLVGVLTNKMTNQKLDIFQQLMTVAVLRGNFGCGFAGVPTIGKGDKHKVQILRDPACSAAELAWGLELHKLFYNKKMKIDFNCLMGHARAPTTGGYEVEDCHPHVARHVIGMHNGTMKTVMGKKIDQKVSDSATLIDAIGTHGIQHVLERSEGDYALVIYNKNEQRLFFVRNNSRPLNFAMVAGDDSTLYWASESGMLDLVLRRSAVSEIKHFKLKADTLLSFRVHFEGNLEYERVGTISQPAPIPKPDEKRNEETLYPTLSGRYVLHADLRAILDKGCANCTTPALWSDYIGDKLNWYSQTEFLCDDCLTHDPLARQYFASFGLKIPDKIKPTVLIH